MKSEKAVEYRTSKNYFYKEFKKANWLILLLGYGIIVKKILERELAGMVYKVHNDRITTGSEHSDSCTEIKIQELESVKKINIPQTEEFGIADLEFRDHDGKVIVFRGIEEANELENVFLNVILKEKQRRELAEKAKGEYENIALGGLEEMNNLVGLWQQGMISDEDFYREEAKLKSKNSA